MSHKIVFEKRAEKEWKKTAPDLKTQFKKKLEERQENPRVQADRFVSIKNGYKIKLRSSGYRLVYVVDDERKEIKVMKVGRRDSVYEGFTLGNITESFIKLRNNGVKFTLFADYLAAR